MMKYILKNYYKTIIFIIIFALISAFLTLLLPDIFAEIISNGIGYANTKLIYKNGIKLTILSIIILLSSILASFFSNKLGAKIGFDLRKQMYKKTINLDEENINYYGIPTLIVRNTNDINQIQNMVSIFFKSIAFTIVLGIGAVIKVITKSTNIPFLTSVVIISIILVLIVLFIIFVTVIPRYNKLQTLLDKTNNRVQEVLTGLLTIRASNQERFEYNKTKKITDEHTNLDYYLNKVMSLLNPFVTLILNLCTIMIIYIIFKYAFNLESLANMLAFSEYATQVISSFLSLAICIILLPKAFVSYNRVNEVISTYNKIYDKPNPIKIDKINKIEFVDVSFNYPNSKEYCLKNINFKVNSGETLAIVGSTGSGKSTIVNLLNRFYDVAEGSIKINDTDIRKISLDNLNSKIATVFQNDFLFNSSIKENLFINSNTKIVSYLELSELEVFKNDLNKKINFDGNNLSGGQKQRLSIARALLKDADILILDDSLSAIDYETEKNIIKNLEKAFPNLIKIIISNRINSVKNANKILVIENGQKIGFGKHNQLIKDCYLYKKMVSSQTSEVTNHE